MSDLDPNIERTTRARLAAIAEDLAALERLATSAEREEERGEQAAVDHYAEEFEKLEKKLRTKVAKTLLAVRLGRRTRSRARLKLANVAQQVRTAKSSFDLAGLATELDGLLDVPAPRWEELTEPERHIVRWMIKKGLRTKHGRSRILEETIGSNGRNTKLLRNLIAPGGNKPLLTQHGIRQQAPLSLDALPEGFE